MAYNVIAKIQKVKRKDKVVVADLMSIAVIPQYIGINVWLFDIKNPKVDP